MNEEQKAERRIAQQFLVDLLKSEKGKIALTENCTTYILNKAGELKPSFMPTMGQLHHLQGELNDLIEKAVRGQLKLDMAILNGHCDRIAQAIAFGHIPPPTL